MMNQQMTNSLRKTAEQTKLKRVATIQPKTAITRAMPKHCNNDFFSSFALNALGMTIRQPMAYEKPLLEMVKGNVKRNMPSRKQ